MAIFHLSHSFLKRSHKSSSVATAAYNAGQKLEDNNGSSAFSDYTRKGGILYDEIVLPSGSPAWANNRGELWRRLESREDRSTRRADAVLAHNFNIALPHELTLEQNLFLAKDFVREQFIRKGYPVDWAIHAADPRGDSRNIHLHILVPLRKIEGESFGNKVRYTKPQLIAQTKAWRQSWAKLANRHLKRYGHQARIDERSFKVRGDRGIPTRHIGPQLRTKRVFLNGLRAKQPPLPLSPILRLSKNMGADGSVGIHATITRSALNKIEVRDKAFAPMNQPRKGWPPEAVADWEAWGHENPLRFFTVWPELAPEGFTVKGGPHL
jgi:hypothetical protein